MDGETFWQRAAITACNTLLAAGFEVESVVDEATKIADGLLENWIHRFTDDVDDKEVDGLLDDLDNPFSNN